ncbi:MAG: glycosyltransferase [Omnitrophica WOR_2 bacterium]
MVTALPVQASYLPRLRRTNRFDIVCFSHLPWNQQRERPQQLLSRFARYQRVFYIEEPVLHAGPAKMDISKDGVYTFWRVIPYLPENLPPQEQHTIMNGMIDYFIRNYLIKNYILWYYDPRALAYTRHMNPQMVVYDCISRQNEPDQEAFELEKEMLHSADLVITDGQTSSEKSHKGDFPSSMDIDHFYQAREILSEPIDQAPIPRPRLGFFGVINQFFDLDLVQAVAERQTDWQFILIGQIVNIDPSPLLNRSNVHYMSTREYTELPAYLAGWDVGFLPVNHQSGSRLSASQIPQYLAAGLPVVSTSVPAIARYYRRQGSIRIGDKPEQFIQAVKSALEVNKHKESWLKAVDHCLGDEAWEQTWISIKQSLETIFSRRFNP